MKVSSLFLLTLLITTTGFSQKQKRQKNTDITLIEIKYGITEEKRESSVELKESPTGTRHYLSDFFIVSTTDSIPAEINTSFGVEYLLHAKGVEEIDIDVEWVFPQEITNEEGEKFKSLRYTTQRFANESTFSSYSLDKPFEVVKGKWTINIYAGKKLLYSKIFILF